MDIAYLNGQFLPLNQAAVSVMDRGFLFGDGVYEVLPAYNNHIFRLEQHLRRLYRSLEATRIKIDLTLTDWLPILTELLDKNSHLGSNQGIYLQISRGVVPVRNHAFPKDAKPTILLFSYALKPIPMETLAKGMSAITMEDSRWQHCNIKSTSLLANVLHYQEALDRKAAEAILIREGHAIEGATSNIFIVQKGTLITPPITHSLLAGVTREWILELAAKNQIPFREEPIPISSLLQADEVWITSSTREIYPITKVDDVFINQGEPGEIWHKMLTFYREFINFN